MDENVRFSGDDHGCKHDSGRKEASDPEILRTYSTGLLALCLTRYAPVVDIQFFSVQIFFLGAIYISFRHVYNV